MIAWPAGQLAVTDGSTTYYFYLGDKVVVGLENNSTLIGEIVDIAPNHFKLLIPSFNDIDIPYTAVDSIIKDPSSAEGGADT